MTLSEYLAVPENYRGVWTTERKLPILGYPLLDGRQSAPV